MTYNDPDYNEQNFLTSVSGVTDNHSDDVMKNANETSSQESKVFIFDIDGTLANCNHRLRYLKVEPKNWKSFIDDAIYDTPHLDIVWLAKTFYALGHTILIVTGRGEESRTVTEIWLDKVAGLKGLYTTLYMREEKDYRDDFVVKKEILDHIRQQGMQPFMVFDDRDSVVKMWREQGIRCMQVQPGNF